MCKILAITKIPSKRRDEIITKVWEAMSTTEKDGYGAAWTASKDELGFYRSSQPLIPPCDIPEFCDEFFEANNVRSNGGPLIIHGRTATCEVSLENTHPFIINNQALVHNGIVHSTKYEPVISTCDSEILLQALQQGGICEIAEEIGGYYAFFALRTENGNTVLNIAKQSTANLHVGLLKENGAFIFATTRALIEAIGGKYIAPFADNLFITFTNGKFSAMQEFTPRPNVVIGYGYSHSDDDWPSYCNRPTPTILPPLPTVPDKDAQIVIVNKNPPKEITSNEDLQKELERMEKESQEQAIINLETKTEQNYAG